MYQFICFENYHFFCFFKKKMNVSEICVLAHVLQSRFCADEFIIVRRIKIFKIAWVSAIIDIFIITWVIKFWRVTIIWWAWKSLSSWIISHKSSYVFDYDANIVLWILSYRLWDVLLSLLISIESILLFFSLLIILLLLNKHFV